MSRTTKDVPTRVRTARDPKAVDVHIGCPKAAEPRYRRIWVEATSEPRWFTVQLHTDPLGRLSGDTVWRYEPVDESGWVWEPYWVDVCDIDVVGQRPYKRCHREQGTFNHRQPRHGLTPRTESRGKVRGQLRTARAEISASGSTDVQPSPDDGYRRTWR